MPTPCPLCENQTFTPLFTCTDYLVSYEKFDVEMCTACGFRRTKNFPPENIIGKYYQSDAYVSHSDTKKGVVNTLYHVIRKRMLSKKSDWVTEYAASAKGNLLDVGAGTGYFAGFMATNGWNVSAVEKDSAARTLAKNKFGLKVYPSLNDMDALPQSFNVITLWHVLEHIEPLNQTISHLHRLLVGNGLLVLALPNCNSLDANRYKNDWAAYDVPRHLWHFTRNHVDKLAQQHGFIVESVKKMYFDGYYISMMSEQVRKNNFPALRGFITGFATHIASLRNADKCSSLVYFLRKK